jgi:hypothetical protein
MNSHSPCNGVTTIAQAKSSGNFSCERMNPKSCSKVCYGIGEASSRKKLQIQGLAPIVANERPALISGCNSQLNRTRPQDQSRQPKLMSQLQLTNMLSPPLVTHHPMLAAGEANQPTTESEAG